MCYFYNTFRVQDVRPFVSICRWGPTQIFKMTKVRRGCNKIVGYVYCMFQKCLTP